jgi:hypothetical protein
VQRFFGKGKFDAIKEKKIKKAIFCISFFFVINVTLLGCATFRGELGPKLYDNATSLIISDNTLLLPQTTDKDFMRIVLTRLSEFTDTEIKGQGYVGLGQ